MGGSENGAGRGCRTKREAQDDIRNGALDKGTAGALFLPGGETAPGRAFISSRQGFLAEKEPRLAGSISCRKAGRV